MTDREEFLQIFRLQFTQHLRIFRLFQKLKIRKYQYLWHGNLLKLIHLRSSQLQKKSFRITALLFTKQLPDPGKLCQN